MRTKPSDDPILSRAELGPYEITGKVGEGNMGAVYLGHHRQRNVKHALKVLHPHRAAVPDFLTLFLREARLAGRLDHPNLVPVYGADRADEFYYVAMPFIDGVTLARMVKVRPLASARAAGYVLQVCRGLEHAHKRNLVHRDVKAANVMVDGRDVARLTDFGLVREMAGRTGVTFRRRRHEEPETLRVLGTPQYMPPEQWNAEAVDGRCDLFALGVTLYHLLTGEYPFTGRTVFEICADVLRGKPVPVTRHRPGIHAGLAAIVEKAIQGDPARRYPNAGEMAKAIAGWLREHGKAPPPARRTEAPSGGTSAGKQRAVPDFARLVERLDRIPALPLVCQEVGRLAARRTTDARTLARAIEKGPALSTRVLRLANSAIYAFRRKVTSLNLAVSLLGNNNIYRLALSVAVVRQFRRPGGSRFNPARFWAHGALTGCVCVELNAHLGLDRRDDVFTFGLLHDVGKIAIYENLPEEFNRIIALFEKGTPYRQAEQMILGFDHTLVGALLAEQWQLPNPYVECIRSHHQMPPGLDTPTDRLRFLVFFGNAIAHMMEAKLSTGTYPILKPEFLARLRLTQESLQALAERAHFAGAQATQFISS